MNDVIELERDDFVLIKNKLVKRIEISDESKKNIRISNDKIVSMFVSYYNYKSIEPIGEIDSVGYFVDTINFQERSYTLSFIFRYQSGTIIIEEIFLEI
jgi:hypothetical protein